MRATFSLPILSGKREAWIRFVQALRGQRQEEYEALRRRLGIVHEQFWLLESSEQAVAVIVVRSRKPLSSWPGMVEGTQPFVRWLARHFAELHGLALNQQRAPPELIAEWKDPAYERATKLADEGANEMSVSENKKIVNRAYEELLNQGRLDVAEEVYAPRFTDNGEAGGPAYMKQTVSLYRTAFPDLTFYVEDQFESGDKVVTRWRAEGTHQGDFMGVPPSGNRATMRGISIHTLKDGQIVSHQGAVNMLSFMQQIGAGPQ